MKIKRKTTKNITMIAVFTALGYALTFIKIPMPAPIAFLDLDFSNVMTMLCGFSLGPVPMLISEAIKQLLCFFTNSTSGGVGQIADFLMAMGYGLIPSIMYYFKRTRKTVFIGLPLGCVGQIVVSLLSNRFITFPLYMGAGAAAAFESVWPYLIAFNAGKALIISVITFLVYKSLSKAMKKIFGEDRDDSDKETGQA